MWEIITRVSSQQDRNTDKMVDMVMNAAGLEFDWGMSDDLEPDSDNFFCMLKDADESLWSGYETHTILSTMSKLLNLKIEFNMIFSCYDRMIAISSIGYYVSYILVVLLTKEYEDTGMKYRWNVGVHSY